MRLRFAAALALLASPALAEDRYEQFHFFDKGLVCLMAEVTSVVVMQNRVQGKSKEQALDQAGGLLRPLAIDIVEAAYSVDLDSTTAEEFSRRERSKCAAGMQAAQQPVYDQLSDELARLKSEG